MSAPATILPSATPRKKATAAKVRAADFLKMDLGEGLHELVDGEILEVPVTRPKQGAVCLNTAAILLLHGRKTGHGHAMCNDSVVVLSEYDVRGADVQYFSEARWPGVQVGNDPPPVPPDLVVEVLSPSDRQSSVLRKVSDYLAGGVFVVLILNPGEQTLTVYRGDTLNPIVLSESAYLERLPELPEFRCRVSEFFS